MRRLVAVLLVLLLPSSAFAAGTIVYQGGTGSIQEQVNRSIANTAPSFSLTDTTASAKSLTIAVDANLAQLRESAGAAGSLLELDLANNQVRFPNGTSANPSLTFGSQPAMGFRKGPTNYIIFGNNGGTAVLQSDNSTSWYLSSASGLFLGTAGAVNFTSGSTDQTGDVILKRNGTTTLQLDATVFQPKTNGITDFGTSTLGFKRLYLDYTNTGTIGAVTINKASFRANIALGATSVVVTNSYVTAASKVLCVAAQNDTTGRVTATVPGAGTVTIHSIATTADMAVDCLVVNAN